MCGSRGGVGWGSGSPLKNYKNIGFSSNTGLDPLKNHKATMLEFNDSMLGHKQHASKMPFKWCFDCGPMIAPLIPSLTKKPQKKLKLGPPLTKLSGSAQLDATKGDISSGSTLFDRTGTETLMHRLKILTCVLR